MDSLTIATAYNDDDAPGDNGGWLSLEKGNRINRIISSPGEAVFGKYLLERVFG